MSYNWTSWTSELIGKSIQPYETSMGALFWVLIFTSVIGYVYLKQQSYTAAAVAALIIVSVFANYLVGVETWVNIIYILIALAFTGLMIIFISKRRN